MMKRICSASGMVLLILAVLFVPVRSKAEDVRTILRIDPEHPFIIHYEFYPPESVKLHEQGKCLVVVFVDKTGFVRAAQLVQSTGFPRLDGACLICVQGQRMLPATLNGSPVGAWSSPLPIIWGAVRRGYVPPSEDSVPTFQKEYELQVGPEFYPADARTRKEKGFCLMYASVSQEGVVAASKVMRSTGSTSLDNACTEALTPAKFIPAQPDGAAVRAGTVMVFFWSP